MKSARYVEGEVLINALRERLARDLNAATANDTALANALGLGLGTLKRYLGKTLTAKEIINMMDRFAWKAERDLIAEACVPVVEFFPLEPVPSSHGAKWELFPKGDHPYLDGLRTRLQEASGIYVFYDSRGQAIYVGKTANQSLWNEMKDAFNRDRNDLQRVRRVGHPTSKIAYKGAEELKRQIRWENVELNHIASYVSAYSVHHELIGKIEALLIRGFANDLLNAKMESL